MEPCISRTRKMKWSKWRWHVMSNHDTKPDEEQATSGNGLKRAGRKQKATQEPTPTASCLHYHEQRFLQVRLDLLAICDGNEAQAKVLQVLIRWTDWKLAQWHRTTRAVATGREDLPEPDLWVFMSYQGFTKETYQTVSHNTAKKALQILLQRGYIERCIPADSLFGTPYYRLNLTAIQQALDAHALDMLQQERGPQARRGLNAQPQSNLIEEYVNPSSPTSHSSAPQEEATAPSEKGVDGIDPTKTGKGPTNIGKDPTKTGKDHTSVGRESYQDWHTSQNTEFTHNTTQKTTQKGNFDGDDDVSLRNERVTRIVTELAAILRLPRTPELRRLVEEYAAVPDLSLLGEADAAREWLANPKRNSQKQTMSLGFFRNWLKREVAALREQEVRREQAKLAAAAQGAPSASATSELGKQTLYPTIDQLGPEYQEYMKIYMRRVAEGKERQAKEAEAAAEGKVSKPSHFDILLEERRAKMREEAKKREEEGSS